MSGPKCAQLEALRTERNRAATMCTQADVCLQQGRHVDQSEAIAIVLKEAKNLAKSLDDRKLSEKFLAEMSKCESGLRIVEDYEEKVGELRKSKDRAEKLLNEDGTQQQFADAADKITKQRNAVAQLRQEAVEYIRQTVESAFLWSAKSRDVDVSRDGHDLSSLQTQLKKEAQLNGLSKQLRKIEATHAENAKNYRDWTENEKALNDLEKAMSTAIDSLANGDVDSVTNAINVYRKCEESLVEEQAKNKHLSRQRLDILSAIKEVLVKQQGFLIPKFTQSESSPLAPIRIYADSPAQQMKKTYDGSDTTKGRFEGELHLNGEFPFEFVGLEKGEEQVCRSFNKGMAKSSTLAKNDISWKLTKTGLISDPVPDPVPDPRPKPEKDKEQDREQG